MALIDYGTGSEVEPPAPITNNGFWPDIEPGDFRAAERIDNHVTAARIEPALRAAMAEINRQLVDWQTEKMADGADTLDEVPLPSWQVPNAYADFYRRAVYATAHASLLERYRDYSATDAGDTRGETKDTAADDYRRDARWAVAGITDSNHVTVELI